MTSTAARSGTTGLVCAAATYVLTVVLACFAASTAWAQPTSRQNFKSDTCIQIRVPADFKKMRNDRFGIFCLTNDIDLNGRPVAPIGTKFLPFGGTLDGSGFVIRNLKINWNPNTNPSFGGLIGALGPSGVVRNLGIVNADVAATGTASSGPAIGILVGLSDGLVSRCYTTGLVRTSSTLGDTSIGGLVGINNLNATIDRSYSSALVRGPGMVGGLVGTNRSKVLRSFAAGQVYGTGDAGGLVGQNLFSGALVQQSFALGTVTSASGGRAAGLVANNSGLIAQSYSAARVRGPGATLGGLVAFTFGGSTRASYWDKQTSGQSGSVSGMGKTTAQLQAGLLPGFAPTAWGLTTGATYPFLNTGSPNFSAPLAATTVGNRLYVFLPISQRDPSQYSTPVDHADEASAAAVYAVVGRAVGIAKDVAALVTVPINIYWDDDTRIASFNGLITNHALLGSLIAIPSAQAIGNVNVIGPLRQRKVVVIRGTYRKPGGGNGTHFMLATSFTEEGGTVRKLFADDPWTGLQVQIEPATKKVIFPARFPLNEFKINAFRVITLQ